MSLKSIYKRAFRLYKKLITSSLTHKYWIYYQILFILNKRAPSKKFSKRLLKASDYQLLQETN